MILRCDECGYLAALGSPNPGDPTGANGVLALCDRCGEGRMRVKKTPYGTCAICGERRSLPYDTPADPPFYPAAGGNHCQGCEDWLATGELPAQEEGDHWCLGF